MSRSRRRTKIFGISCGASDKKDKIEYHRKYRRLVRSRIKKDDTDILPDTREVSDPYGWSKDGKSYWRTKADISGNWIGPTDKDMRK